MYRAELPYGNRDFYLKSVPFHFYLYWTPPNQDRLYWIGFHRVWYCSVRLFYSIDAFVHTVQCIFSLTGQVLSFNWEFFPVIPHVGAHSIVVRLFHGVQLWWRILCYHSNDNILNSQGKSTTFFSSSHSLRKHPTFSPPLVSMRNDISGSGSETPYW